MNSINELQIAFYEDAILYEQEQLSLLEMITGVKNISLTEGYVSVSLQESVSKTIKTFIDMVLTKLRDLLLKVKEYFKKRKNKNEEEIVSLMKKVIAKGYSIYTTNVNKTVNLKEYAVEKYIDNIDQKVKSFMLTIRSVKLGYQEYDDAEKTDKKIAQIVKEDEKDSEAILRGIKDLRRRVFVDKKIEVNLSKAKELYADYSTFVEISEKFIKQIETLANELFQYKKDVNELPTDINPNTVTLLRKEVNVVYTTTNKVISELTAVNDTIRRYYITIFIKFVNNYNYYGSNLFERG